MDDLFALYRLCGGDATRVIELLARLWGAQPQLIAPTVRAWLGNLPAAAPPPSRSRTAPPALPSWFLTAGLRAAAGVGGMAAEVSPASGGAADVAMRALQRGINLSTKPPPLSAPAAPGETRATRSFDMLALQQAVEQGSSKLPTRSRTLTLQPMPEEGPVSFSAPQWMAPAAELPPAGRVPNALTDDALGAFMYSERMGGGRLGITDRSSRSFGGRHMR